MLLKLPFIICLATMALKGAVGGPLNDVLHDSNGQSLKEIRVQESTAKCSSGNKGLLRMVDLHLEFCDGKSWVRLSDEMGAQNSREKAGIDCQDIKSRGLSQGDGLYWLDPDAGSHSNAFLAYCDMTSYNGGWTMCFTTNDKVKPKSEVTYKNQFPYGRREGYRTNCNNIPFTEIMFVDHQTGAKVYFKHEVNNQDLPITAAANYGNAAGTYGVWHGVGASNAYRYQLLICDDSFFSGFFVSGYTGKYKTCDSWRGDKASPYFRTASTHAAYKGVAFNTNGHYPNVLSNRLISVGLRYKRDKL